MPRTVAKRPLRQRIVALLAAYAIALASLIAGFGAAQAAATAADGGAGIICHSDDGAAGSPTGSHDSNAAICLKSCVGCMASLATVIPPTLSAGEPQNFSFQRLGLPAFSLLRAGAKFNAHRSRGPPPAV